MSPYLARLFLYAAVMYMDNTNLLHWADAPEDKNEELIENFQRDIKAWGENVQSTGGILKAMKWSLFPLTYKWPNGRACHKTINNPTTPPYEVVVETTAGEEDKVYQSHAKIPQPHGINLPIQTYELEDTVNMLGFYHSLGASKSNHVK